MVDFYTLLLFVLVFATERPGVAELQLLRLRTIKLGTLILVYVYDSV